MRFTSRCDPALPSLTLLQRIWLASGWGWFLQPVQAHVYVSAFQECAE